jgi:hypothetical protein
MKVKQRITTIEESLADLLIWNIFETNKIQDFEGHCYSLNYFLDSWVFFCKLNRSITFMDCHSTYCFSLCTKCLYNFKWNIEYHQY